MKIKLTSIPVTDPIKAFKFYTEVLGFKEHLYMPEAYLAIVVSSEDPSGTALLLEPGGDPIYKAFQEGCRGKGLPVIVFGSDNVQKDYERLTGLGVVFKSAPVKSDWGTSVELDDTVGNWVQLHQDPGGE